MLHCNTKVVPLGAWSWVRHGRLSRWLAIMELEEMKEARSPAAS